jgi:hypothetical protein
MTLSGIGTPETGKTSANLLRTYLWKCTSRIPGTTNCVAQKPSKAVSFPALFWRTMATLIVVLTSCTVVGRQTGGTTGSGQQPPPTPPPPSAPAVSSAPTRPVAGPPPSPSGPTAGLSCFGPSSPVIPDEVARGGVTQATIEGAYAAGNGPEGVGCWSSDWERIGALWILVLSAREGRSSAGAIVTTAGNGATPLLPQFTKAVLNLPADILENVSDVRVFNNGIGDMVVVSLDRNRCTLLSRATYSADVVTLTPPESMAVLRFENSSTIVPMVQRKVNGSLRVGYRLATSPSSIDSAQVFWDQGNGVITNGEWFWDGVECRNLDLLEAASANSLQWNPLKRTGH